MRKVIVFLFFQVFLNIVTKGQCPSPSFIINDTACQGAQISFTNTSLNGTNFSWDFCTGDLLHPSYDTSSESLNTLLQTPAGVVTISESGSEYVFVCSRDNGRLVRLEYGNGIENPSTGVTDLGNLSGTVGNPNGIAAFQESGIWYLLLTDVFSGRVGLTAFGNGVSQAPTLNQIIINGGLSLPRSIKVFKEATDSIFAFVTNYTGNTLSVFSFGTSILNAPQLLYNIPIPNSNGLIALDIIKDCNHLFGVMCSYNSTDIAIADFGSSITSSLPTFTSMSAGPQRANDISIVSDGQHFFNVIASGFGVMILQQFGSSLVSPVLEQSSQFSVASNSISGSGMFKKKSKWYGLFPQEYGNVLSRLDGVTLRRKGRKGQEPRYQ